MRAISEEACLGAAFRQQGVLEDLFGEELAVVLAANFSTAISSLVVDPGYTADHYQSLRGVANGAPSFLSPPLVPVASFNAFY